MTQKAQHRAVQLMLPKIQKLDIEFENLTFTAEQGKRKKEILHGINGTFKSGELTGIMGPSGAGKSTLLNIISGFQKKGLKGTIRTSQENKKNDNKVKYKKDSCYILQDDRLYPLFTVQEIMVMATKLKLGYSISEKAKEMLIFDILDTLGLTNCMETKCGKLSGGQRKRLSIALELIDNPPIMFLDEPTTGLDSSATLQCITTLKSLSQGGRTIVCTIHQPSATIFEMFDHIYILAEGHCIYQGAPQLTVNYLSSVGLNCPQYHNPADYILEVANKEYGNFNDLLSKISTSKSWRIEEKPPIKLCEDREITSNKTMILVNSPSEMYKFWVLLHRSFLQLYRDWTLLRFRAILNIIVGVVIGLLYQGFGNDGSRCFKNVGYFLVSVCYVAYTTMMPAILKVPLEVPILKKEWFNNWYSLRTYYFAVMLAPLPAQIINVLLYTLISFLLSSQLFEYQRIIMYIIILLLTLLSADGFGLAIGATLNPVNGVFIASVVTAVFLGLSGFLIFFSHMSKPMYLLSYISYMAYGVEGLAIAMYGNGRPPLECPSPQIYCHHRYPSTFLKDAGLDKAVYLNDVLFLVGMIITTRILAYFALIRRLRDGS